MKKAYLLFLFLITTFLCFSQTKKEELIESMYHQLLSDSISEGWNVRYSDNEISLTLIDNFNYQIDLNEIRHPQMILDTIRFS